MSNALATLSTMDLAYLTELSGMARKEETSSAEAGPAVLKINYDEESVHGTGVWVVGQKKDKDNNITEQGVLVAGMIILAVKMQRSYYDEKNVKNSLSTQLFNPGSNAPDNAEFESKLAAIGKGDHKGYRWVCFGMAILPDGNMVECVSYFGGTSYVPFREHHKTITEQKVNGNMMNFPPFVCVTNLLPPDKGKNGSRVYYIAKFAPGAFLERDMIIACGEKREEVYDYIDRLNSASPAAQAPVAPAAPVAPPAAPVAPPAHSTGDDVPLFAPPTLNIANLRSAGGSMAIKPSPATPATPAGFSGNVSDIDLEAAINAAL